jgi:hypothetical protein
MEINWNNIKTVNGRGHRIPEEIRKLISSDRLEMRSANTFVEFETIHCGQLYEAAYYAIDLFMEYLRENQKSEFEKYLAFALLNQYCLSYSDEDILIKNDEGVPKYINLTLACRKKIKTHLSLIKDIKVHDLSSEEMKIEVIKIIELWDEEYSNDLYDLE